MSAPAFRHVYGPVPSRRLGRSLGVDLIPFKHCTYDCVYCQLGRTTCKTCERAPHTPVAEVLEEVARKLEGGVRPDYISLAGSGEPTLHTDIGAVLRGIKALTDTPVAVLTNGSLLWREDVRGDLAAADRVAPSLDAADAELFRRVNRPHADISFERMLEGLKTFTKAFSGEVWLEVFLLAGVTGVAEEARKLARAVKEIRPARTQLNTVARPPAEGDAFAVPAADMEALARLFDGPVDIIAGAPAPGAAEHADDGDILALLARRPCTVEDTARGLGIPPSDALKRLELLVRDGRARTVRTEGRVYHIPNRDSGDTP